ncbi:MAG: 2-amino-4-hydroxy-6-hydroxymethyldihydropteridine diphosphokinase [Betaproteobacteria bacterium]|nr:2-amino-4-hydroxy-6-hydroxymethyldihydropteridine diphosphokinase [Betaproteobacteria bacterium]
MHRAFLGLGANLGDPAGQIRVALQAMRENPGITFLRASSLYASAPMDAPGQAEYVNAVAMIDTVLIPSDLLRWMLDLESRTGRERSFPNAPRTLDLDLLLYDDVILGVPELKIPHPRMHLRRFVLEPLLEIAPEAKIPGHGAAALMLAGLAEQTVRRIADA